MVTLGAWERLLNEKIAYVELLGEIVLADEEVSELGAAIAQLVTRNGPNTAIQILERNYPACLAVYLVHKGIASYEGGDYWSGVSAETGLKGAIIHTSLGRAFERFVSQRGLPAFSSLGGMRYVAPILLHGGIPDYSLNDFFAYFLQQALARSNSTQADAQDFIDEWLYSIAQTVPVDKPIRRFLEHGGNFALSFVVRCLEMAISYEDHGSLPTPEESGLSPRVLARYKAWVAKWRQERGKRQPNLRLVRPEVFLDPWGEGPLLELPTQRIPRTFRIDEGRWIVRKLRPGPEREVASFPLSPQWAETGWETTPYQWELPTPGSYSVTLALGETVLRTWYMQSEPAPVVAFDAESGELLQLRENLPARRLWLLCARNQNIQAPGGRRYEVVTQFSGSWARFKAECWDLSAARMVEIDDKKLLVEPDLAAFQPYLQGNEVADLEYGAGRPILYRGALPDLCVPLPPQRDPTIEAKRWRITVRDGQQRLFLAASLADVGAHYLANEGLLQVSLGGLKPFQVIHQGCFEISLRGPLGRDVTFQIAVVPTFQLRLRDRDRLRIPVAGKLPSVSLAVNTSEDWCVDSLGTNIHVVPGASGAYHVQAEGPCSRVDLCLRPADGRSQLKIPISIPLPYLTWAISEEQGTLLRDEHWVTQIVSQPQAWLEQAVAPRLFVALRTGERKIAPTSASLLIRYSAEEEPQVLAPRGRSKTWAVFNLQEALDSVRAGRSGSTLFELELFADSEQAQRLPVLRLKRALGLSGLSLQSVLVEQTRLCALEWQEEVPFRNRQLLFWSLWRPWEEELALPIPDSARNVYNFEVPVGRLAPGRYRAEMVLVDPWLDHKPVRPVTPMTSTVDVVLGDARERIDYLRTLPRTALGQLERLLASENALYRLYCLRELVAIVTPREIPQLFDALLTLVEKEAREDVGPVFSAIQNILVREPVGLLAAVASRSLLLEKASRLPYEELLWRLSPDFEPLLRQIYQEASIAFDDLVLLIPGIAEPHMRAEVFSLLAEAGVQVKESVGSLPAALPEQPDLDLPDWLFSDYQLDSMRLYLHEISQYQLLNAEQERRLAQTIAEGVIAQRDLAELNSISVTRHVLLENRAKAGKNAHERLVTSNLRLVVSIARRYLRSGMDFLDVIQNGNLGLLRAIDKFDGTRGYKFSTYATWWIRQSITRVQLENIYAIRLPAYLGDDMFRLKKAREQLLRTLGRAPTGEELAEAMALPIEKIKQLGTIEEQYAHLLSLEEPLGDEDGTSLSDTLEQADSDPANQVIAQGLRDQINKALSALRSREREVIELRYGLRDGDKHTLEDIGQQMHVTRERVRQIEEKALKKLRTNKLKSFLSDYV